MTASTIPGATRRRRMAVALVTMAVGASFELMAQAPPASDLWFRAVPASVLKTRVYEDPSQRFTIEVPAKDWQPVPGGIDSLVLFQHKKGQASAAIELQTLNVASEQRAVNETFVTYLAQGIRAADPKVGQISQRIITAGEFRVATLVYDRPGISGPEELRVYYLLRGRHLFRLICRTAKGQMTSFETVFAHMAATFNAAVAS